MLIFVLALAYLFGFGQFSDRFKFLIDKILQKWFYMLPAPKIYITNLDGMILSVNTTYEQTNKQTLTPSHFKSNVLNASNLGPNL